MTVLLLSALLVDPFMLVFLVGYLIVSAATYVAYGMDKSAAQHGAFRTQESALHLLALMGGWPGALLAQKHFHHKTRKQSFQSTFWVTVVLNCVILMTFIGLAASSPG